MVIFLNKEKVMASTSAQHHVSEKQVGPYANIPGDIVIEILKRLPAKSILRFRSVCKQWRSTTQEPAFISAHNKLAHKLAHMRTDGGGSVLIFAKTLAERAPRFFSAPYEGGVASSLLQLNHAEKLHGYNASQPTQGLVLLFPECQHYEPTKKVYVFNPTTRELVPLPPLDKVIHWEEQLEIIAREQSLFNIHHITVNYYLGYDPSTEIYKVLSICSINYGHGEGVYGIINLYYLFTLGANEYWRKLDSPPYLKLTWEELDPHYCCVNGSLYFTAILNPSHGFGLFVAFDIGKEEFHVVEPQTPKIWPLDQLRQVGNHLALCHDNYMLLLEDQIWTCVDLRPTIKSIDIVGGTQLKGKYSLMIAYEDVDEDEEENEVVVSVVYCDKGGNEWSEFKITCLADKKLFVFQTTNTIETLFSPSVCLK